MTPMSQAADWHERKKAGGVVRRDSDDTCGEEYHRHDQSHQALAEHVALRGAEDLGQGEFHRCEKPSAAPDQAYNGHYSQEPCVLFHAAECLEELGMCVGRENSNQSALELLLRPRIVNHKPNDAEDAEHQREHRKEGVEGQTSPEVARLTGTVCLDGLRRQ